jgi:hypothetical protein
MAYASLLRRWEHRLLSIPSSPMATAICLKKGQLAFPGLQGETPAHDAMTLQRYCTRWQALHSLPTRSEPERQKAARKVVRLSVFQLADVAFFSLCLVISRGAGFRSGAMA